MVGSASACRSGEGSKRRSSVAVRAASVRCGREAMAGRKGVAVGLRVEGVEVVVVVVVVVGVGGGVEVGGAVGVAMVEMVQSCVLVLCLGVVSWC
jgi:hypothetical protein